MKKSLKLPLGLYYKDHFINKLERKSLLQWLSTLHPLWEMRFSKNNPPPPEDQQRPLLRPVYWLGNWQFACLNYYHPPQGIKDRCLKAEPYPSELSSIVKKIEDWTRIYFPKDFIPPQWELNTCLINFYGDYIQGQKKIDRARVGEHRDFEPGPVASLSLGESAFFQFVKGNNQSQDNVVYSQWLHDSSLQLFAGPKFKNQVFHRVQRVENKNNLKIGPQIENFQTRRINFTFRYVPREHIYELDQLSNQAREDIYPYLIKLSETSLYFGNILKLFNINK